MEEDYYHSQLKKLTLPQLKNIVRKYNLSQHIKVSKLKKEQLILALHHHTYLDLKDNMIKVKTAPVAPEKDLKTQNKKEIRKRLEYLENLKEFLDPYPKNLLDEIKELTELLRKKK
jgi:hypothetical protein